jgi:hypothetical protein
MGSHGSLIRYLQGRQRKARLRRSGPLGAFFRTGVVDVHAVVGRLSASFGNVACLKLEIEGGEYGVLERLLDTGEIVRCRSLLVQFHGQPQEWRER